MKWEEDVQFSLLFQIQNLFLLHYFHGKLMQCHSGKLAVCGEIQMSFNIVTVLCCYCCWWGIWEPDKKMKCLTTVWLIGRYNTCLRYTLKRVLRYNNFLRYIEHWSDIGRYNTCLRYTLKRVLFLKAKICCPWLIRHQETDINDRDNICFRIRPL